MVPKRTEHPFNLLPPSLDSQVLKEILEFDCPEPPIDIEKYFVSFEDDYEIKFGEFGEFLGIQFNDICDSKEDSIELDFCISSESDNLYSDFLLDKDIFNIEEYCNTEKVSVDSGNEEKDENLNIEKTTKIMNNDIEEKIENKNSQILYNNKKNIKKYREDENFQIESKNKESIDIKSKDNQLFASFSETKKKDSIIINAGSNKSINIKSKDNDLFTNMPEIKNKDLINTDSKSNESIIIKSKDNDLFTSMPELKKNIKYSINVSTNWSPPDFEPKLNFPFTLDTFQLQSFYLLSQGKSILVTAHTSSGKTTLVDYAILLSTLHKTKVIYTSPIKALSNQKYNEFKKYNPGLITGDITLNNNSEVLIVTTEILRNLLYSRSNLLNNLEYVVFDEVHYVNNADRGVVWEECIIMLPEYVCVVMLSACIPNALEFGEWVGRVRKTEIYVVATDKRAVPLEYYVCVDEEIKPVFKENSILSEKCKNSEINNNVIKNENIKSLNNTNRILKDKNDVNDIKKVNNINNELLKNNKGFNNQNNRHIDDLNKNISKKSMNNNIKNIENKSKANKITRKNDFSRDKDNIFSLNKFIVSKKLTPAIFFIFSRKKCHDLAKKIMKPLLTENEKQKVSTIITEKLQKSLSHNDQKLPQIKEITTFLLNGISVHHSGLLPIIKELVEILFSQNLIKILFATETFSMGVNFPAKSVVFMNLKKRDNAGLRLLNPGEFMQMSGRAGRRNVDTRGIVIVNNYNNEDRSIETTVRNLVKSSTSLVSRFKISYNMVLQLFRSNMRVEDILRRSFCEDKTQKNVYLKVKELLLLEKIYQSMISSKNEINVLKCKICYDIRKYVQSMDNFYKLNNKLINFYLRNINYNGGLIAVMNDFEEIVIKKIDNEKFCGITLVKNVNQKRNNDKENIEKLVDNKLRLYDKELGVKETNGKDYNKNFLSDSDLKNIAPNSANNKKKRFNFDYSDKIDGNNYGRDIKNDKNNVLKRIDEKENSRSKHVKSKMSKHGDVLNYENRNKVIKPFIINHSPLKEDKEITRPTKDILFLKKDGDPFFNYNFSDYIKIIENNEVKDLFKKLSTYKCLKCNEIEQHHDQILEIIETEYKISQIKKSMDDKSLVLFNEYYNKIIFLNKYNYIDSNNKITIKGRVACEIKTVDEIFMTEMITRNKFKDYSSAEIMAFASCLIVKEIHESTESCELEFKFVQTINEVLAEIIIGYSEKNKVFGEVLFDNFYSVSFFNGFILPIYDWCNGICLSEIVNRYQVSEGILVRTVLRIDEFCKEIRNVCVLVNDMDMLEKIENALKTLKRDIIHCTSLYIDE